MQVCNNRLLQSALAKKLEGSITLRKKVMNEPYQHWGPSFVAPGSFKAFDFHSQVVADVVESLLAAYLIDKGPAGADAFLQWLGLPVACGPNCIQQDKPISEDFPIKHRDCKCWYVLNRGP